MHPLGLNKRLLFKQGWACANRGGAGTEAHLAAIRAFHKAAWECFDARKVEPPEQRVEYHFVSIQGEHRSAPVIKRSPPTTVDPRTKKAMLAIDRDCLFCCQELHRAVDSWPDGSRSKIRAIEALSRWRADYDRRWATWLRRGNKRLPAKLQAIHDFALANGRICFVAGSDKYFATGAEARRYTQSLEEHEENALAKQWHNSETNQKLMAMFDEAVANHDESLWQKLEQALKAVEDEDKAAEGNEDGHEDN